MSFYALPSHAHIENARRLIAHKVLRTPIMTSDALSYTATSALQKHRSGAPRIQLFFKCENLQRAGSFKVRSAMHFVSRLSDDELRRGVVAYSTGNHALALAHAAHTTALTRTFPIPTYLAVPHDCPATKIAAAQPRCARRIHSATGAVFVPPPDHVDVVLGQATAVAEFLEQVQVAGPAGGGGGLHAVIVPSGGGGLLVGAAAACRGRGVRVFGAEPECGGPGLAGALERGARRVAVEVGERRTVADGLRTLTGEANWEHIRDRENVERVFTASEDEVRAALRAVVRALGFAVEPSAAVALAVVLSSEFHAGIAEMEGVVRVGVVLTGGNIGVDDLRGLVPGVAIRDIF
ncbi:tryptophan synthase beta subunit-like PLP-dependent enzyme [Massariosphaeria phaeospora]|uniref:Tryptophan synthase beta subunit-like PLP-dependent enzyme n=1 Tax=Massariosphaeria phaeospora TaxID=100035 RepID=A0A7C8MDQ8_9PLEO|nr:tryptophan synthase beta subunit-like PLP-dependent enzyme [Massariosphaeria phaeospora]